MLENSSGILLGIKGYRQTYIFICKTYLDGGGCFQLTIIYCQGNSKCPFLSKLSYFTQNVPKYDV